MIEWIEIAEDNRPDIGQLVLFSNGKSVWIDEFTDIHRAVLAGEEPDYFWMVDGVTHWAVISLPDGAVI